MKKKTEYRVLGWLLLAVLQSALLAAAVVSYGWLRTLAVAAVLTAAVVLVVSALTLLCAADAEEAKEAK